MRTHLYQPILKPDGSLCIFVAVTFLTSGTNDKTPVLLYADENATEPLDNPMQFAPGIVEVWADETCRLDIRVTADNNFTTTLTGIDMAPAPEEMLVVEGGFQIVGPPAEVGQVFGIDDDADEGIWTEYDLVPDHDHDGFAANSTVLGDAKDPTTQPFALAGASGGSMCTPVSGSAGGSSAAVAMQWKANYAGSFKAIRIYCTRTPTGVGGCTVGIASAIGSTPAGATYIQSTTGVTLVAGWNVIVLPSPVTVVAGTNYYLLVKSTGQDVNAIDTTGPVLGGAVTVPATGGTGIPLSVTFSSSTSTNNVETLAATYGVGEGWSASLWFQWAAHVRVGVKARQYYIDSGVTAPSGVNYSANVNFKLPANSAFNPTGTVDVIDYYSLLYWYNRSTQALVPGWFDTLPTVFGTGAEVMRIKSGLGSMMRGIVGAIVGKSEPVLSTAATSATAWTTSSTIFGAFEVGDVSGIVDAGTGSTWLGTKVGQSEQVVANSTALGSGSTPNADSQVFLGSNTIGTNSSTGAVPTQAVTIGTGSYGYKDSVVLGTAFGFASQLTPFVWHPQFYLTPLSMTLGTGYSDNATTGIAGLGAGGLPSTTATKPLYLEIGTFIPGDLTANGDVLIGHDGATGLGFFGVTPVLKPSQFPHQTNVALQNLFLALKSLGLLDVALT